MNNAYTILRKLLCADTDDLALLARIAGLDPKAMYAGADLKDANLSNQDVSFLYDLETNWEKATLSNQQVKGFRRESKNLKEKIVARKKISSIRRQLVSTFIDRAEGHLDIRTLRENATVRSVLEGIFLKPLDQWSSLPPHLQCGADYISATIVAMFRAQLTPARSYVDLLFQLYGDLRCRQTSATGTQIAKFTDAFLAVEEAAACLRHEGINDGTVEDWIDAAGNEAVKLGRLQALAKERPLRLNKFLILLDDRGELIERIHLVEQKGFKDEIGSDVAIAASLFKLIESTADLGRCLSSDIPAPMKTELFRQTLIWGEAAYVISAVDWLNSLPGGVGGLAISDAILHTEDIEQAMRIADHTSDYLESAQTYSMFHALDQLPKTADQAATLDSLKSDAKRTGKLLT